MLSLHARVLMTGTAVLVGFFSLAGLTLQQAFNTRAEIALQERLLGQVYVLIAAFEQDEAGQVKVPDVWGETKFSMLNSKLLAEIKTNQGKVVWQSYLMNGVPVPTMNFKHRNMSSFLYVENTENERFAVLSVAVALNNSPEAQLFIFSLAENMAVYSAASSAFHRNLWISLAVVALLLLILQSQSIRWVLSPLKVAEKELSAIEAGTQDSLGHEYPNELIGLTDNINGLLRQQKDHLKRYRDSLSDLAHSLKTPLAVLQTTLDSDDYSKKILQQQIDRIAQITEYQLNRAALAGMSKLRAPESVFRIGSDVLKSLEKVYKDKTISIDMAVPESTMFHGDPGDLMEMLGNLLDNAFKWTRKRVRLSARTLRQDQDHAGNNGGAIKGGGGALMNTQTNSKMQIEITIEDDGPGISEAAKKMIFDRGIRADQNVSGHGIGLAIVSDIVMSYQGRIEVAQSDYGGAKIILHLP